VRPTKKNPHKKNKKKEEQMGSSLGPGDYIKGIFGGLVILAIVVFVAVGLYYNFVRPAAKGVAKGARKIARSSLMAAS
jgi:hypothetical protein